MPVWCVMKTLLECFRDPESTATDAGGASFATADSVPPPRAGEGHQYQGSGTGNRLPAQ